MGVIPIDNKLVSIKGIGEALLKRLAAEDIHTIEDLRMQTITPKERRNLATKINYNVKKLYIWAKHADLMRVKGIDAVTAELLVSNGIRNVEDLANADVYTLKQIMDSHFDNKEEYLRYRRKRSPELEKLSLWKKEAASLEKNIINDADDFPSNYIKDNALDYRNNLMFSAGNNLVEPAKTEGVFFSNLSEMMIAIGRGVAEAQHELDLSSIAIQNYIDANDNLRNYGLSATWYVMPETTFQMKVNYAVVQEVTEEKDTSKNTIKTKLMRIAPVNAKYQNLFKSTSESESEFTFKIVPVPTPVDIKLPVIVPDLVGLSLDEAEEIINENRLILGHVLEVDGELENDQLTQVISQSLETGTEARVNDIISLTYSRRDDEEE